MTWEDYGTLLNQQGDVTVLIPITQPTPIPTPPVPVVRRTLRLTNPMMRGDDVKELQNKLTNLGYSVGAIDGIFGKNTKAGVFKFQMDHGLLADGIVGKNTWQAFDMIDIITTVCNNNAVEPELGIAVASAESSLNPKATLYNPPSKSTDRGLYEINDKYHSEVTDAQAFDPTFATTWFCNAIKSGKLVAYWSASQPNWSKHISEAIKQKYGVS
jgi:peptidoglycan hydrolase-like protein with peptidoglycan-binding domain